MTLIAFLILLLIAGVCGAIGQAITGFDLGGILVSIAVGFIGAVLGGWLVPPLAHHRTSAGSSPRAPAKFCPPA